MQFWVFSSRLLVNAYCAQPCVPAAPITTLPGAMCYVKYFCVMCCLCFVFCVCVFVSSIFCVCVYKLCCVWMCVHDMLCVDIVLLSLEVGLAPGELWWQADLRAPQWHLYPALSNEPLTCVSFCICGLVKGNFWIYWHLFCIQRGKKHNFGFVLPECVFHLKGWLQSVE